MTKPFRPTGHVLLDAVVIALVLFLLVNLGVTTYRIIWPVRVPPPCVLVIASGGHVTARPCPVTGQG